MATVKLTWVDPTTQVGADGKSGPIDPGFSVSIFDSTAPAAPIGTVAAGVQTFTTGPLTSGDHTFAVVITSAAGMASVPSNTVTVTVSTVVSTPAVPSPATDLVAVLIP